MKDHNRLVEGEGVYAVGLAAHSLGILFRQAKEHDKGIDAELELILPNNSSLESYFIGLQIKSRSKLRLTADNYISVTVTEQNLQHWKKYGRPVLFMLYSQGKIYWTRVDNSESRTIKVPVHQQFDGTAIPILQQTIAQFYINVSLKMPTENAASILSDLGKTIGDIVEQNIEAIKEADDFLLQKNYAKAVKIYEALSLIYKQSQKILYNLGVSLLGESRIEEALNIAYKIIEKIPDEWQAYYLGAGCLIALHRFDEAEKELLKALEIAPRNLTLLNILGLLLYWQDRNEEALHYFFEIIKNGFESVELCYNIALAFTAQKRHLDAITMYEICITLNPNFISAYNSRALLLKHFARFTEALECFDKALELSPKNLSILYNSAFLLKDLDQNIAAIQRYEEALKYFPDNQLVHFDLGALYCRMEQPEVAAWHFNKCPERLQITVEGEQLSTEKSSNKIGIIDIGFEALYIITLEVVNNSIKVMSVDNISEKAWFKQPDMRFYMDNAHLINRPLDEDIVRNTFRPRTLEEKESTIIDPTWFFDLNGQEDNK